MTMVRQLGPATESANGLTLMKAARASGATGNGPATYRHRYPSCYPDRRMGDAAEVRVGLSR